ncbi:MAG: patatin-like phospholipase family protein [Hyphomicrobiaceae bacterium]|jgi:NTE family protein
MKTPAHPQRRTALPVKPPTIALALGGGGARGLAHILMLEVFDEMGLKPRIIAGTSIGAIFGAAYASGLSAKLIRAHTEEALGQRFGLVRQLFTARSEPAMRLFRLVPMRSTLLNPETLANLMLPDNVARDFAHLKIPLRIVATDFHEQDAVVLTQGPLRPAIAASMALPALFSPVTIGGRTLMDGGLVNPLPFDVVAGEADVTIAIDVSGANVRAEERRHPSAFEALVASSQILQASIVREKLKSVQPDIYIDVDVDKFHVLDFLRYEDVFEAAAPAKAQLRRQLQRVLASQTLETIQAPEPQPVLPAPTRKRRLGGLRRPKRNEP